VLLTLIFTICQVDLSALFTTRQQPVPDNEQVITINAVVHHLTVFYLYFFISIQVLLSFQSSLEEELGSKNTVEPNYFELQEKYQEFEIATCNSKRVTGKSKENDFEFKITENLK